MIKSWNDVDRKLSYHGAFGAQNLPIQFNALLSSNWCPLADEMKSSLITTSQRLPIADWRDSLL